MTHLFHPALVHFPIALLIVGSVWEAAGHLRTRAAAVRCGGALVVLGTLALLPALVSGYLAAGAVPLAQAAERTLGLHEVCGWSVAALYTGLLFGKAWNRGAIPPAWSRPYAVLLLLGSALVVCSAVLGGELVYVHATGVAAPA
jgi:uncharacterized membrane protein